MQAALERALADLAFGPEVDPDDPASVDAWIERNEISPDDAAAIRQQGAHRLLIYRTLVRSNLREAIELACERTVARLGDTFERYLDRFLRERGPRTHYLRDVITEFLDFCEPLWERDPAVPGYLMDLARHENIQIEIGAMQAAGAAEGLGELDLKAPVRFIDAARVARYDHAVHELADDPDDRTAPEKRPTALFVYRNPEHEVRYLELTPLAATILERLLRDRQTLEQAIVGACESQGVALDQPVLDGTAQVLADLADRGALLGGSA